MIPRVKYSRTYHLPWSLGRSSDDKSHADANALFAGHEITVTEKLDGENTTIYADGYSHARSLDSQSHVSRDYVRALAGQLASQGLPEGMRIAGENLYAEHSIAYRSLPSYFIVFGIYLGDRCLSWDDTVEWCRLLELPHAPVLYRGLWDEAKVRRCWTGVSTASPGDLQEGYVVRLAAGFDAGDFSTSVAKFVRENHVQTADHWMHKAITPNRCRDLAGSPD